MFEKLKAFFTKKNISNLFTGKEDGTITLSKEQAEAVESLASDLDQANASLATAQENLNKATETNTTRQSTIDAHVAADKKVRTELGIAVSATTDEVVTAIQGLKTQIETLGKQPGSLGKNVEKKEDKVENGSPESADKFRTKYDDEADAELAAMGITAKKK